jgi:hypothetical protein
MMNFQLMTKIAVTSGHSDDDSDQSSGGDDCSGGSGEDTAGEELHHHQMMVHRHQIRIQMMVEMHSFRHS